jgi:hypothetical protein
MQFVWLEQANEKALSPGIPLHFKQYGHPRNNPAVQEIMSRAEISWTRALQLAIDKAKNSPRQRRAAQRTRGASFTRSSHTGTNSNPN